MESVLKREEGSFEMTLKAAVIYDDFDFAVRATALLERVAFRNDEAVRWDVRPWRLDMLKQPLLAGAAITETANADLIMFALGKTLMLPEELLGWLGRWAGNRRIDDAALMVVFPHDSAVPMPLWNQLEEFAEWHDLPFLGSRNLRDDGDSMAFVRRLWQRKQPVIPVLSSAADRSPRLRNWGINE